jgi:hypothetical protein
VNGLDAETSKPCDLAGVNSWESQNVMFWKWGIAAIVEFADDWFGAMPPDINPRSFRHPENTKLGAKHRGKLGLRLLDAPSQVPDPEETPRVDWTAFMHVRSIHVRQARCRQINARAADHTVLDRNVADMVVFQIRGRFDLNEPPSTVSASMQNIYADEHVAVLKGAFEDRPDVSVSDYLSRGADRLIQAPLAANLYPARKQLAGEHADLAALLNDCLCRLIRLRCQFWLVNLKIKTLEALHSGHVSGLCKERHSITPVDVVRRVVHLRAET